MALTDRSDLLTSGSGFRCLALAPAAFEADFLAHPAALPEPAWRALVAPLGGEYAVASAPLGAGGARDLTAGEASDFLVQACVAGCGVEWFRSDAELAGLFERHGPPGPDLALAWELLVGIIDSRREGQPWWLVRRFHGNCAFGLTPPARVAELAAALAATPLRGRLVGIRDGEELERLADFVCALPGSRWLLAAEWT